MAVNYTDLFENVGEFVERVNYFTTIYTTLDSHYGEIKTELEGNGREDVLEGLFSQFVGFKGNVQGWVEAMVTKTTELLTERDTVLDELPEVGNSQDIGTVLGLLIRDMNDNAVTVDRSTVTISAVTEDKQNADAGTAIAGKVLDGMSQPHLGFPANPEYLGQNSELAATSDIITLACVTDNSTDNVGEGNETFRLTGGPFPGSRFSYESIGSGDGPTCNPLQGYSLLGNLDFENFTSDVPDDWTLDAGTATTHVMDDAAAPVHGDTNLKLTGDAAQASIQLSQDVAGGVSPRTRYAVGFWLKGQAGTSAGTLTIQFEGTDYTAGASEKISLNAAALAAMTTWTWNSFHVNMPAEMPDDMELVIKWTGTPSAHSVRLDWGGFGPVTWFDGCHFFVYSGTDPFLRGDRFRFTITNDDAGVFQKFFRDAYGVQLPSSGTPSLADTLASD